MVAGKTGTFTSKAHPDLNLITSRYTASRSSVVNPKTALELTVRADRFWRRQETAHIAGDLDTNLPSLLGSHSWKARTITPGKAEERQVTPNINLFFCINSEISSGYLTTPSPNSNCILLVRCFHQHLPVWTEQLAHASFCPTSPIPRYLSTWIFSMPTYLFILAFVFVMKHKAWVTSFEFPPSPAETELCFPFQQITIPDKQLQHTWVISKRKCHWRWSKSWDHPQPEEIIC